jgi:hypothetical protein
MERIMTITERAACALDATLVASTTSLGVHTENARVVLSAYLDGAIKIRATTARKYCQYLEMIARAS